MSWIVCANRLLTAIGEDTFRGGGDVRPVPGGGLGNFPLLAPVPLLFFFFFFFFFWPKVLSVHLLKWRWVSRTSRCS
jgi:hypothetical protein